MKSKIMMIAFAIVSGLIIFSTSSFAAIWTIRDTKGGQKNPDGSITYDYVYTDDGIFHDYIKCRNTGHESCPKKLAVQGNSQKDSDVDQAMQYAFDQIYLGNFENQQILVTGLTVKWSSEDADGNSALIKVWETGETEPEVPQIP